MQGIRLDQNALEIQLSEKLLLLRRSLGLEHRPLVVLAGGVAGLAVALSFCVADGQPQGSQIQRNLGNVDVVGRRPYAEPPPAVGSIEPLKVLPSHTS